jgi:hypothetical protein
MTTIIIQKRFRSALAALALASFAGIASAQITTNIEWTFDTTIPVCTQWYGSGATFEWSTNNNTITDNTTGDIGTTTNATSGSLEMDVVNWSGNQEYLWIAYDGQGGTSVSVNLNDYTTEEFDIMVDTNSAGSLTGNGDFGNLQIIQNVDWSQTVVSQYTIPASAANGWIHVSVPIAKGLGISWGLGFGWQSWNPYPSDPGGNITFYIDNFTMVAAPPAPVIAVQPVNQEVFPGGNVLWNITATGGLPLSYQWYKGTAALNDQTNASGSVVVGSQSNFLTITNVSAADFGNYKVIVTNAYGSITSSVVSLSLVSPCGAEALETVALAPTAFYELNETANPTNGNVAVFDHVGGYAGTYNSGGLNEFDGIFGPSGPGFCVPNGAAGFTSGAGNTITLPAFNFNLTGPPEYNGALGINTMTITAWIYPTTNEPDCGIIMSRVDTTCAGFCYVDDGLTLGYNWANSQDTWGWQPGGAAAGYGNGSGLQPGTNQWSFAALVIDPYFGAVYMMNGVTNGEATNFLTDNPLQLFEGPTLIGQDPSGAGRTFGGSIDDVAIFPYELNTAQLQALYYAGVGGPALTISNSQVSWVAPFPQDTVNLLQAPSVNGPWTTNTANATPPVTITTTGAAQYYMLQVILQ